MLSLYRTLSVRFFQQRRSRAFLVLASVALGVALLVATRAINASMMGAARAAAAPFASHAELNVSSDGGVPFSVADQLTHLPGVLRAEPLVFGRVRLPGLDNRPAQVIGLVWRADSLTENPWGVTIDWVIAPGTIPGLTSVDPQKTLAFANQLEFHPVLVGEDLMNRLRALPISPPVEGFLDGLAKRIDTYEQAGKLFHGVNSADLELLGWSKKAIDMVRSRAELLHGRVVDVQPVGKTIRRLVSVGVPHADSAEEEMFLRDALVMNAVDAAAILGQPGRATRIDLFLQPGADAAAVANDVRNVLHGRAQVRTPDEDEQRVQSTMAGLEFGFSLLGAGALVVGLFLIYLVLSVSVVERRHEIGILRSLGATRPQVWALFVGEAAVLGLLGAGLGIPLGLAAARYVGIGFIQRLLSDFLYEMKAPPPEATAGALLVAMMAGVIVAVLAALWPAVRAGQEEPASAVRRIPPRETWGHRLLQLTGSVVLLVGGALVVLLRTHFADSRWGTFGGFGCVLLGTLLAAPLLASVLARLLQPVARLCLGMQGRLAADNLVRAPGRTGLVITVLSAGVAIFIQTAGVIRSNKEPILNWVDRTVDADLFITSGSAQVGNGQNLPIEASLAGEIQKALNPQVQAVVPTRSRQVSFGNQTVYLLAIDVAGFADKAAGRGPLAGTDLYAKLRAPGQGSVVISRNFAALYRVHPGDEIQLDGARGPFALRVVGVVENYDFNRGTILMDRRFYEEQFRDPLADDFYVYVRQGVNADAVRTEIAGRWGPSHALLVLPRDTVRQHFQATMDRFAAVAYSQEAVVGLVSALGVVFALLIAVLQRRRELGVLRAIGATRSQVLRSVLAEAVLMGAIGSVIGVMVGVPVEWYIMKVILFEETGLLLPMLIPWGEAAAIAGGALLVATLAGLVPALRTIHLRIPEAIAYE